MRIEVLADKLIVVLAGYESLLKLIKKKVKLQRDQIEKKNVKVVSCKTESCAFYEVFY